MFEKPPEPKTKNQHESTWDFHGSYQWTYFADEIKQRIKFFLQQRLHGKNIEIGGGWYLSYPNSTVVDLSSVCLSHNPAKEKLQFDLDTIGEGARLPFDDDSFDSATLISTWQYLRHPKAVFGELERILDPGAEIYLINGQGAGLQKCKCGISNTKDLQAFFEGLGYDTLIEHIPTVGGDLKEFQSLCVAMPDINLFGKEPSKIRNKKLRQEKDEEVCKNPSIFIDGYKDWEMADVEMRLAKLSSFPVTQYSIEFLDRAEAFSQEFHSQTGDIPLVFLENGFEPNLAMLTPERHLYGTLFLMLKEDKAERYKCADALLEKYEIGFSRHCNYFRYNTPARLLEHCAKFELQQKDCWGFTKRNDSELNHFADFLASIGLNSFTKQLQQQIYDALKPRVSDLDKRIQKRKAFGCHMATFEHKQKRNIDELIAIKDEIEPVETRRLDFVPLLPVMREYIS
jgi:SAM-dependent methyltransferase